MIVNIDIHPYESVRLFVSTAVCCCLVTDMKCTDFLFKIIVIRTSVLVWFDAQFLPQAEGNLFQACVGQSGSEADMSQNT